MDFSRLSQVGAPDAVTEPSGSFPSQTDAAIVTTWCAVLDLARVFCSISVRKGKRNLLTFRRNRQQCAFKDLHQGYVHSPTLHHNIYSVFSVRTSELQSFKYANVRSTSVRREWNCSLPSVLLLLIFQLYHLPPLTPAPVNSPCLFSWCWPLYASAVTLLHFARCCTLRLKMFPLLFPFVFNVSFVWRVL